MSTSPKVGSIAKSAIGAAAWMLSAAWLMSVLQLVVLFVLSRTLLPSDFGLMAAALVVIGVGDIFANLGVGAALVQSPEVTHKDKAVSFWISLVFGLIAMGVVFGLAGPIAGLFRMPDLAPILAASSVSYVLKSMAVTPAAVLQRELRFREVALVEVVAYSFGYALTAFALSLFEFGAASLVGGVLVQASIRLLGLWSRAPINFLVRVSRADARKILFFGGGITLSAIFNYAARNADYAIIGRLLGESALGLYGRAYRLMTTSVSLVAKVLDKVLFSALSRETDLEKTAKIYRAVISLIASSLLPLSAFSVIFAPEIVGVALGEGWEGAILPFRVLSVGIIFRTSYKISGALARARGAVYQIAWRNGIYAISVSFGSGIGAVVGGLEHVAAGVCVALALFFYLMTDLCITLLPLSWSTVLADHIRALFFTLMIGLPLWGVRYFGIEMDIPILLLLAVGSLAFGFLGFGLVAISPHFFLGSAACDLLVRSAGLFLQKRPAVMRRVNQLFRIPA